ncbi:D-2-hydroxyacid dehydrogenase family protein [Pantoea sp. 18069]|uniref:D-2-hydroxyacid dehydrogenase family protein n=1 Tax=Pantoea sp. 18069 TaxID=2681415 RepID=UPI00135B56C4|nr:D-2-hydroxyacid dehydrogenase family protein [Pantoea sp. 18069]
MTRIAILDDHQQLALDMADWASLPGAEVVSFAQALTGQALVDALADFDVVVAMRERTAFSATLIGQLPRLRLIASTGLRNAAIDLAACQRAGITVTGARGAKNGLAVTAETAWALLLALHKRVLASHLATTQGCWQPLLALPLEGRVLGLVGLGNVGRHMARVGQAFGMHVIAWSPHLTDERAAQAGVRRVDKHELFATADAVSLHLVLSPETARVVAAAELAAMQSHAFLVNTARAGLVDETALVDALACGRIGGAGLDVFWQEPLPATHALCALPNVVLTPHLGYVTQENLSAFYRNVVHNIRLWMDGGAPQLLG